MSLRCPSMNKIEDPPAFLLVHTLIVLVAQNIYVQVINILIMMDVCMGDSGLQVGTEILNDDVIVIQEMLLSSNILSVQRK